MTGVIWRRNGDHPHDGVGEIADWHGTGEPYEKLEGAVVRFYRHPWSPGDRYHTGSDITEERGCGYRWHDHGWIDQGEDGITVCPGDMVYTRPDGAYGVRKGHEMTDKTMGQVAFEAYRAAVKGQAYDGTPIPEWDSLDGDRLKAQGGWEAAALAVIHAEAGADAPTAQDFREFQRTRWTPVGNPPPPAEVGSLPPGVTFTQLPPVTDGERTSVPVDVEDDDDLPDDMPYVRGEGDRA